MPKKNLALLALLAAAISPLGFADTEFCTYLDQCSEIKIQNSSSALVTSVVITQEKTDGKCALDERTVSQNLTGGTTSSESFKILANARCQYKVQFKTTSGCTGDKTTHMRTAQLEKGLSSVVLKGACGSLKVKKN